MAPKNKLFQRMEYDDCWILSEGGDITMVFALEKKPYHTRSSDEFAMVKHGLVKAMKILQSGWLLHWQDRYYEAQYVASSQETHELRRCYNRHFDHRTYFRHESYLSITITGGNLHSARRVLWALKNKHLTPKAARDLATLRKFQEIIERFILILQQETGIGCRLLTRAELMGTRKTMGLSEPSSLTVPAGSNVLVLEMDSQDGLKVGNQYVGVISIADPESLPSQISPVICDDVYSTDKTDYPMETAACMGHQLHCNHVTNLYILIGDVGQELKNIDRNVKRLLSVGEKDSANLAVQRDSLAYRDQLGTGECQPVWMHANVIVWSPDRNSLSVLQQQVVAQMMRIGVTPRLETLNAARLYAAAIPGNAGDLHISRKFRTFSEQACCFVITESAAQSSESPSSMPVVDRATGIPLNVDFYEEPKKKGLINNFNKTVVGPSGSGKSVWMQKVLAVAFWQGHHIMAGDIGGSYKALCLYVGGQYFAFDEEKALQFNPFLLNEGEGLDAEKMESLVTLLIILWKTGDQEANRSEYVALSDILRGYYQYLQQGTDVFPCFDSLYEWLRDICIPRLQETGVREKDFDWTNFLFVLRPYYRGGEYEHLLNAREDLNLFRQRFVVFELDVIKDHPILFPVVTLILMQLYLSKLRKLKRVRKILVLDEAWKALKKPATAEFVQGAYKTVRKYNGEIIVATQDAEDLYGGEIVKNTIINNADTKIILDVRKLLGRFDEFQAAMGLTEKDKMLLFSLNREKDGDKMYKEFFVTFGNGNSSVYRLELPLEELLLYTTDESHRVKMRDYSERHGDWWEGIKALAADVRRGAVKLAVILAVVMGAVLIPNGGAKAQIIDIAEEIIKEALETADLNIQRLQTQTILLQNAEKALENTMAGDLLDDITGWVQQQEELFGEYYGELWQVKSALSGFSRVSQLIGRQAQLVADYQRVTAAIQRDPHFSVSEVSQMLTTYSGILSASVRNTAQLALVIQSFSTQMDDAGRLRIIDETAAGIDHDYAAFQQYTQENTLLSLQRAKDENEIQTVKALYGL